MNRSVIDEVRLDRLQLSDATMPLIEVKYSHVPQAGEATASMATNATIQIAPTSGSGSKLRVAVILNERDESGSTSVTSTTNLDGATYTTLGSLITALNAIDGVSARRLNAPADYSLDSDDFVAMAATDIREVWMPMLYKDASEILTTAIRIGIPEVVDSGRMKLLTVAGTTTGNTNGTVKISRDPNDESASDEEEIQSFAQVEAETAYVDDDMVNAAVYRGPLLIEVTSDDLSACDIRIKTVQAEW